MGLMRREPAKTGKLPPNNVAIAKVNRIDRRDIIADLPFHSSYHSPELKSGAKCGGALAIAAVSRYK